MSFEARESRASGEELFARTRGPKDAPIVIVGEAFGAEEAATGLPFVGTAGYILKNILLEAGIDPNAILYTNIISLRPPGNDLTAFFDFTPTTKAGRAADIRGLFPGEIVTRGLLRLQEQIRSFPRRLVIGTGNYPLWALSELSSWTTIRGKRVPSGIISQRGSQVWCLPEYSSTPNSPVPFLPIVHPAAIARQWALRQTAVHDLRVRVPLSASISSWLPPDVEILAAPPYGRVLAELERILARARSERFSLVVDIETLKQSFISCIGIGDRPHYALVIPFVYPGDHRPYWTPEQEVEIISRLRRILLHPSIRLIGQNFLYDMTFLREELAVDFDPVEERVFDTMLGQHSLFPGIPKDLAFLSSLYCSHHRFWKDDAKEWDETGDLAAHLAYNGEDIWRTYEIATEIEPLVTKTPEARERWTYLRESYAFAFDMMRRGVLVDEKLRHEQRTQVLLGIQDLDAWFHKNFPQSLVYPEKIKLKSTWWQSSSQLREVLLSWGVNLPRDRKTGKPSTGKEAIPQLAKAYPGLIPIFERLIALRSLRVFYKNVMAAKTDVRRRMRIYFNPSGTETYRYSSSKDPFGRGLNGQNIPKGTNDEDEDFFETDEDYDDDTDDE